MNEIPRVSNIDAKRFKNDHVARNLPVIVTDHGSLRETVKKWNFDYLASKHPGHPVAIDHFPDGCYSPPENRNPPLEQLHMSYKEYVARIRHADERKKLFLAEQTLREFPPDIVSEAGPPAFLGGKKTYPVIFMGIDTYSHAHYHPVRNEAVLMQMQGRKKLILIAAKDYRQWYPNPRFSWNMNWSGMPMALDPSEVFNGPDGYQAWVQHANRQGAYGDAAQAKTFECVIEPGEILFIPQGWFHLVYGMGESISVTHFFRSSWRHAHPRLALRDGMAWLLGTKHRT
jgi:hypothetical protein